MKFDDIEQLYFIWNADWSISGALSAAKDFVQGVEACALCEIAYSGVRQKSDWKECKASIPVPIETLYKNKLPQDLSAFVNDDFPLVLVKISGNVTKLVAKAEIEACEGSVEKFKELVTQAVEAL